MSTVRPFTGASAWSTYDEVAIQSAAAVISAYSTSFGLASRLLAEPVRTHVRNIYALVRIADEIVDSPEVGGDAAHRETVLTCLEEETARALRHGYSSNLVVHAFASTARAVGIGADLVDPFFDSMRTDLYVTSHDRASLERYIYGSAEVVGLMCLHAFLADQPGAARYADLAPGARRLGAAFQKVNFVRDLAEDRDLLGRSYLAEPAHDMFTVAQRDALLDDIDSDLEVAGRAIPLLPSSSRRAVRAAHALFCELSCRLRMTPPEQIRRERVSVPSSVKARLLARALVTGGAR